MKSTVDRRNEIIKSLAANGKVRDDKLSKYFNVSTVTIRNDLDYLEKKKLVHRAYGGALSRESVSGDSPLAEKQKKYIDEKRKIGVEAAKMIFEGDSIILDSGTTTQQIAKNIKRKKDIIVLTNAINIAMELASTENITVMLLGGILRKKSYSVIGSEAESIIRNHYFDKFFLGIDGFDLETGITTPNSQEAQLNRIMVQKSKEIIIVTDSSKFGNSSFSFICSINDIDKVITDENIPDKYIEILKERDIELIIV